MTRYLSLLLLLLISACTRTPPQVASSQTPRLIAQEEPSVTPSVTLTQTPVRPTLTLTPTASPTHVTPQPTATRTPTKEPLVVSTTVFKSVDDAMRSICLLTDSSSMADSSVIELVQVGMTKLASDFGLEAHDLEEEAFAEESISLELCFQADAEVIVTVGFHMREVTLEAAKSHPEHYFLAVDQYLQNPPPNLTALVFREDQAGFLAGALACMMTKSHVVGGVYGPEEGPIIRKYRQGFENGCRYVHLYAEVNSIYLPERAHQAASQDRKMFYSPQVDVVFDVGWETASGSIRLGWKPNTLSVYADSTQYDMMFQREPIGPTGGYLLAHALKEVDLVVYAKLQALVHKNEGAMGSMYVMGTANGGIDLSSFEKAEWDVPFKVQLCVEAINESLANDSLKTGVDPMTGQLIEAEVPHSVPFGWNDATVAYPAEIPEAIKRSCLVPNPNESNVFVSPSEAPMVVVPAGEFLMGSTLEQLHDWEDKWSRYRGAFHRCNWQECFANPPTDELYQFTAYLDEFEIDKFEVTNYQYRFCVGVGVCKVPVSKDILYDPLLANHPVVRVTQQSAATYCEWLGKRLPTEAEWEKTARGTDGRIYPWGNEWDENRLNIGAALMPVGSFPAGVSPVGAFDMAGNASEWTSNEFRYYPGNESLQGSQHPLGRPIYRGGHISINKEPYAPFLFLRSATRYDARRQEYKVRDGPKIGIRCARGAEQKVKVVSNPLAPQLVPTRTTVDRSEMVLVPAGEFTMGRGEEAVKWQYETPAHQVYLDGFYIDRYEVTVAQYVEFLNLLGQHEYVCEGAYCLSLRYSSSITKEEKRYQPDVGKEQFPVKVTWYGAKSYCEWLGKRLPTEAEWEKAARGTDGRKYPWGNDKALGEEVNGYFELVVVGSYPIDVSPYGVFDMHGNAEEWTADWFDPDYYMYSPERNPMGPVRSTRYGDKVVRSGLSSFEYLMHRDWSSPTSSSSGFRCAISQ